MEHASTANAVAVSGSDVFIVGYEKNAMNISVAKYWKNGVVYPLTDGTRYAVATSICTVP